jgi:hypothetical protein
VSSEARHAVSPPPRADDVIADSGEGYATRQKARQGIDSVKQNAPDAAVEPVDG